MTKDEYLDKLKEAIRKGMPLRTALEQAYTYGMCSGAQIRERREERAQELELEHLRNVAEFR